MTSAQLNISTQLENALRRATDAIRLILIAYLNSREIPITLLKNYAGPGPYIHGAKGVSVNKNLDISSLKSHFMKDIPLARKCFEESLLGKSIIKLKNECVEGIEKSPMLFTLVRFSSVLDSMDPKIHVLDKCFLDKIRSAMNISITETDLIRMIAYLNVLFPNVVKVVCGLSHIHDFLIANFDDIKSKMPEGKRLDIAELYTVAFTLICPSIQEARLVLSSPIIKFRVNLETLYDTFEYAYWLYVTDRFRERNVLSRFVDLRDLIPLINKELKKRGYLRSLTLREVFDALKQIELENFKEGRIWFKLTWNSFPGEKVPLPVEFYAPKKLSIDGLREIGFPVDNEEARRLWDLS